MAKKKKRGNFKRSQSTKTVGDGLLVSKPHKFGELPKGMREYHVGVALGAIAPKPKA